MKPLLKRGFFLVFLLVVIAKGYGQDVKSSCRECGQRIIKCWDLDILTSKPLTAQDSILWKEMHYATEGYIGRFMNVEDPECLAFLPACRIGDDTPPWLRPCPFRGESETETFNYDYEMFGEITGQEGAYELTLKLVTVKRELVASITEHFEKATDAKWQGELASLNLGGSESGSRRLYETIHEFEVKKRNAAQGIKYNRVALNASVASKSDNNEVDTKAKLPIDFELKDCDDEPLKTAKLELHVSKGSFEKTEIETDEKGIAHAVYIAPDMEGTADVKAEYNYRHPSDKLGFASDFTSVKIIEERRVKINTLHDTIDIDALEPVFIELREPNVTAMKLAILSLSCSKGKLEHNSLKPDAGGKAITNYTAPGNPCMDTLKVIYRYKLANGNTITKSAMRIVHILKPVRYLTGRLNVAFIEKVSTRMDGRIIKTRETKTHFGTTLVFKIDRMRVALMQNEEYRQSQPGKMSVLEGDSYYKEWDYSKGTEPIMNIRSDIEVNISSKTEGYRSFNREDWGVIHTFTTEDVDRFQHVVMSFVPEQLDENLGSLTGKLPYILTISAALIPENLSNRDYDKTPNGSAKTWNGLTKTMEDDPPPFQFNIPYESFFSAAKYDEATIQVTPMKLDAAQLNKFLLKPIGSLTLNLTGTAMQQKDNENIEQQITVELDLSPANY